jgi:branched-chain amino acid transport system permease protein
MDTFIRLAVAGLSNAALYALIAFSVVLVYRGSGVKNFGVGHLAMFGGLFFTQWNGGAGGWSALGLAVAVSMVIGVIGYFVAVRPAERRGAPQLTLAISTLGYGLVLYFIAGWVWDKRASRSRRSSPVGSASLTSTSPTSASSWSRRPSCS